MPTHVLRPSIEAAKRTSNDFVPMRGQVTALYLFMFTFFGAMGPAVIGFVSTFVVGDEQQIWKAILITAVIFLPTATFFMWRGIKPYREEVERLEALGL